MNPNNSNQYLPGVIAIPSTLQIVSITNAMPAVITCVVQPVTSANTYIAGQLVKLIIPNSYGMQQANNKTVQILSVNGLQFTIALDTTQYDAFAVPASTAEQPASMAPAGSRNLQFSNNTAQLGFESLNNIGN